MEQVMNGFRVQLAQGRCVICRYEGGAARVEVPRTLGGLPVRMIGGGAFRAQEQLREVILPDSVEVIDHHAFAGCTALTRLSLGRNLRVLGADCLAGCTALMELALPGTLRLMLGGALAECASLRMVHLPAGAMVAVSPGAFEGCGALALPVRTLTRAEADALPPVPLTAPEDGERPVLSALRLGCCYAEPHRAVLTFVCAGILRADESGAELLTVPEADWRMEQIG